ncbi:hypothetical protein K450DRAFT_267291 [Umbelopsis ramanniana AG]|uniref:Uncharacterized protein n=1 Tax=Umbelopsis ramanniana AG TaxID=1314678 RepID=A0AAD5EJR0_UMBRA|nr:uncharacterized protein K450DRAFT_267291 [Umbelopsis ramanniana AG]KAI8584629.1 hypothetical protein K450DRAFT_267291 [Umbelopsis ramanniana AG]
MEDERIIKMQAYSSFIQASFRGLYPINLSSMYTIRHSILVAAIIAYLCSIPSDAAVVQNLQYRTPAGGENFIKRLMTGSCRPLVGGAVAIENESNLYMQLFQDGECSNAVAAVEPGKEWIGQDIAYSIKGSSQAPPTADYANKTVTAESLQQ